MAKQLFSRKQVAQSLGKRNKRQLKTPQRKPRVRAMDLELELS
jgi:hypothetical protein